MSIEIRGLSYRYPSGKAALKGVDLSIKKGEHHFIIGKTGSGKSTLIQMLNGLKSGSSEVFEVCNLKMNKDNLKRIRKKVGMVIQFPENQIFESTIEKEIAFGLKNQNVSYQSKVKEIMDEFKIDYSKKDDSPFLLSGGQMRKVAIASILVLEPEVIVLDEPTCGLDPVTSRELMEILERYKKMGKTIIHITHDMNLVCEYSDSMSVLKDGRILLEGKPEEVFAQGEKLLLSGIEVPPAYKYNKFLGGRSLKNQDILDLVREVC